MTIHSILAETKHLIPNIDARKVICILKTGKEIDVKVEDNLDYLKIYDDMRSIVYGADCAKVSQEKEIKKPKKSTGTIIRRDTDNKIFNSASKLCTELGILASSSGSVISHIKHYGLYRNVPYTILEIRNRKRGEAAVYTPELIAEMRQLFEDGLSTKEVAVILDMTPTSVAKAKGKYLSDLVKKRKRKVVEVENGNI